MKRKYHKPHQRPYYNANMNKVGYHLPLVFATRLFVALHERLSPRSPGLDDSPATPQNPATKEQK